MGSGLLRELQFLKKITFGGVYVTDPVVATFSGPELTDRAQERVTVADLFEKVQFYDVRFSHSSTFMHSRGI